MDWHKKGASFQTGPSICAVNLLPPDTFASCTPALLAILRDIFSML